MSDEVDDIDTSVMDQRNFLLMVSPADGQKITSMAGFSSPSPDVQEAETLDVIANWITLAASGSLHYVRNASQWMADFITDHFGEPDDDPEHKEGIVSAYYAFSVGLLTYMLQSGVIEIYMEGDSSKNLEKFIEYLPNTFSVIVPEEDSDDE